MTTTQDIKALAKQADDHAMTGNWSQAHTAARQIANLLGREVSLHEAREMHHGPFKTYGPAPTVPGSDLY